MWGRKKATPEPAHVETAEEYWAKRDAEREAREAEAKREADAEEVYWEGYAAPIWQPSDGDIFNYELSAYSDTVGYYADGVQRVCPIRRK